MKWVTFRSCIFGVHAVIIPLSELPERGHAAELAHPFRRYLKPSKVQTVSCLLVSLHSFEPGKRNSDSVFDDKGICSTSVNPPTRLGRQTMATKQAGTQSGEASSPQTPPPAITSQSPEPAGNTLPLSSPPQAHSQQTSPAAHGADAAVAPLATPLEADVSSERSMQVT